jgi:eukaryotic-like serine/threonine-protein kinase
MATGHDEQDPDRTELLAPAARAGEADGALLAPGTRIGRYRIEACVGRGGMGEVYRAGQLEPVRRTVALKLLRAQRLEARHRAYFEVERQVLAQMRHPAIAQIYDADTTEAGQPYFAMEYIEGSPVTRYCDAHDLPLARRLALFIEICAGVQHAHQKGVVHRDLKPGNLLVDEVDGQPHPKIIDFGIATAGTLAEGREVAGTPDYMSPEQAGDDQSLVDTRSDVYSLGVVLNELLTGQRPTAAGQTVTDDSHTLRLPSQQLATLEPGDAQRIARSRGEPLPRMRRLLSDELDWVVAKAMRHDRNARYASAAALAEDLQRFLDGRTVLAVPPSSLYAWRKFARRHRSGLAAAGFAVVALLGGLAMSVHGLLQARAQRAIAEQRSAELEKVAAFQQSMLENLDVERMGLGLAEGLRAQVARVDPAQAPALEALLAQASTTDLARALIEDNLLVRAEEAIATEFADQPALAADLREASGRVHDALGMYEQAAATHAAVVAYRTGALGPRDPATLRARYAQAQALVKLSRYDEARALLEAALQDASGLADDDGTRATIELELAEVDAQQGDLPGSRARREALLARLRAARGDEDPLVLRTMMTLASVQARMGDVGEARATMETVLPVRVRTRGDEHPETLAAMGALATMRALDSAFDEAAELQRRLVEVQLRRLGREHPDTLAARGNLANMLSGMGRTEEALAEARSVLDARTRVLGARHPQTLRSALNVASFLARLERFDEAIPLEEQVLAARREVLGPDHPDTLFVQINHGVTLQRAGLHARALGMFDEALPRAQAVLGEKHPQYQLGLMMQGDALVQAGQAARGAEVLQRALALRKQYMGPDSPETPMTAWTLVKALRLAGREEAARAVQRAEIDPLLATDPATLGAALRDRQEGIARQIRERVPGSVPR